MKLFLDRFDAGRQLAHRLISYTGRPNVIVLALPRGGLPVAYEVASALHLPMDVFVVRKLGVPSQPELAMGAIATGGVRVLNDEVVQSLAIPDWMIDEVARLEQVELEWLERGYRADRPAPSIRDRIVILIDDGLATGSSMRAAIAALRSQKPARIIAAVPVGAADTCAEFRAEADEVICLQTPDPFYAVGRWYGDFSHMTGAEARELLDRAAQERSLVGQGT